MNLHFPNTKNKTSAAVASDGGVVDRRKNVTATIGAILLGIFADKGGWV